MWAKARIANSSRTKAATFEGEIATLQKVLSFLSFPVRRIEWMMVSPAALLASCEKPTGARHDNNQHAQISLPNHHKLHHLATPRRHLPLHPGP